MRPDHPAPAPPRYPPIQMTAMPAGAVHSSPAPVTSVDSPFVWPAPRPPPTPRPRPPTTAIAAPRQATVARTHRPAEAREDARTPGWPRSAPRELTRREREIHTPAAQGLSNGLRQRVVLTVGIIEGHLSRASVKLGISDAPQQVTGPRQPPEARSTVDRACGAPRHGRHEATSLGSALWSSVSAFDASRRASRRPPSRVSDGQPRPPSDARPGAGASRYRPSRRHPPASDEAAHRLAQDPLGHARDDRRGRGAPERVSPLQRRTT
jgi:hypothetical protein